MSDSNTITETMDVVASEESTQEPVMDKKKKPRKKPVAQSDSIVAVSIDTFSDAITEEFVKDEGTTNEVTIHSGVKIESTVRFKLFETSVSSKPSKYIKGEFYVYSDDVIAGRIRITDSFSGVRMQNKCIGWVNIDEVSKFIKEV